MNSNFSDLNRGNRLKEERKRLKLTQKDAAIIIEMQDQSWIRFEKRGEPFDLRALQCLEENGFDMMYVVFGIRKNSELQNIKPEHLEILRLLNEASEQKLAKIIQMIQLMASED
ncbi:XRE family transcriptional regulator [Acinetobacter sp. NIPH 1852]|uniref:XRE family transcriptional regulator n=1 Tax=Acinetobacter sp. NIPH 1852 TaxID=2923428 RepID=UPI001F4ADCDA|nr:XRE family transcriptional regulator [Acinetobacter sp. NIPH 1852]MCH7306587.1 XRE family transcriptional regulator [Acinetobacter sp. NIPH 1852]